MAKVQGGCLVGVPHIRKKRLDNSILPTGLFFCAMRIAKTSNGLQKNFWRRKK